MSIVAILVAVVLAILAFKFVKGVIKFGLLAIIIIVALWFLVGAQHGSSAVLGGGPS